MADLSPRERLILYAAVSEFVQTGEPVGSRTLSRRGIDLSPATIRNVLADLESSGYLLQPHTSAGRVPTPRAFRLYIDALMEMRELSTDEHALIRRRFDGMEPGTTALRETGRLLSELTGTAAVVVAPRTDSMRVQHLRFIRTQPGEVLAVLVMADGTVQNRFLQVQVTEDELQRIHGLLDDLSEGRSLGDLRDLFARRKTSERAQVDALRRTAYELGEAAVSSAAQTQAVVFVEGHAKLLQQPEFGNPEGIRQVMGALDDVDTLLRLLDAAVDARGTAVFLGRDDTGELGGGQLAMVSASYRRGNVMQGALGVIGPTRMDYPKVVPLVTATASAISQLYERERSKTPPDDDED